MRVNEGRSRRYLVRAHRTLRRDDRPSKNARWAPRPLGSIPHAIKSNDLCFWCDAKIQGGTIASQPGLTGMTGRRSVVSAVIALAFVLGGLTPESRAAPPSVLLVTVDTLRADHLTCYGYERNTSPHMDEFARRSTRVARAYATAPWTVPTHASIFTGLFPFQHGAHTVEVPKNAKENAAPLSSSQPTLAEVLRRGGYRTAAVVANSVYLAERFGMDRGFETYTVKREYGVLLNSIIFKWLRQNGTKPFFLFVNYIDTHRPYNISPRPNGNLPLPSRENPDLLLNSLYDHVMGAAGPAPRSLVQGVIDQYDTAIANVDQSIGELFAFLKQHGLFEDTMIILTSDHGEYFGEHALVEHSKDVYEQALRVPLIIKLPGQRAGVIDQRVISSVDLAGMIVDKLPAEVKKNADGLFPFRPGNHPVLAENYYTRLRDLRNPLFGTRFNRIRTAFYRDRYKYIRSNDGKNELYDLRSDPGEQTNLIDDNEPIAHRCAGELESFQRARPTTAPEPVRTLNAQTLEQMRALGY
jgi:arylsulfatase A-like enzyme